MPAHQDTAERLVELFRSEFGGVFKQYYNGDPEAIPLFNLPALIVTQTGDTTTEGAMGEDDIRDSITVKVVYNKRDDFDADQVNPLNTTDKKIRDIVGRRDPETGDYVPKTVKHVIRSLAFEGVEAVAPSMTVEYGINPRPGAEGYADLTSEGHVSFDVQWSADTY